MEDNLKNKINSHIKTGTYKFNDMSAYGKSKKIISIIEKDFDNLIKHTDDIRLSLPLEAEKEKVITNYNTALMLELSLFTWDMIMGSDIDIQKFYNSLSRHCKSIESLIRGDE